MAFAKGKAVPRGGRGEPSGVRVRLAGPGDVEAIARLRVALHRAEAGNPLFTAAHPRALERSRALTRAQLQRPGEAFFLAVSGDAPVGVLRCREARGTPLARASRFAAVTTAYVVPAHRRRGVLRILLAAADAWCRERDLPSMRLRCGLGNAGGLRAWSALGFAGAELLLVRTILTTRR